MTNSMPKYYSQHGEDFVLDALFRNIATGFFVEVGCIDGKRFSNTLTFEKRGWTGLCVEAHAGYIELLHANRPRSIIEHCAVSNYDEDMAKFYANSRGSLSTLDKSKEDEFAKKFGRFFSGFQEQLVPKRTLNTLFSKHNINIIDILSVDVEGHEVEVIQGIDFLKYQPQVLLVESDSIKHEQMLSELLMAAGYNKYCRVKQNIFFVKGGFKTPELRSNYTIQLLHTNHPLDNEIEDLKSFQLKIDFY